MADDGYVEVPAVIRMPKGGRLADSRRTEGWSRGFTPKSSERGPEHVEIRLTDPSEPPTSGYEAPDTVYLHEYAETHEKTQEELEVDALFQALVLLALLKAAQWAQPHLRRLLTERVIPFFAAKRAAWRERTAQRNGDTPPARAAGATLIEVVPAEESTAVRTALEAYEANMTSDEARRHLAELLIAQRFVEEKKRLLADARLSDAAAASPEVASAVQALGHKQVVKALESILASRPTALDEIRRLVDGHAGYPLQLGSERTREALRLTIDR